LINALHIPFAAGKLTTSNDSDRKSGSCNCYPFMNQNAEIEYVVRVKLPSSSGYHSSPSGDTEYETAYNAAIFAAKPEGFEVSWASRSTWPVDKDGMTWVKLYCTDKAKAIEHYQDRVSSLTKQVERLKTIGQQLVNG